MTLNFYIFMPTKYLIAHNFKLIENMDNNVVKKFVNDEYTKTLQADKNRHYEMTL